MGYKRFHYFHWGGNSTHKIILLHGLGESADIWFGIAPLLSGYFEVIGLDLRGHGGTPWDVNGEYSIDSYADDTQLILSSWNEPCIIIGHGMGANIAIKISENFSGSVEKTLTLNHSPPGNIKSSLFEQLSGRSGAFEVDSYHEEFQIWDKIYKDLTWAKSSNKRTLKCDPKVLDYLDNTLPIKSNKKNKPQLININYSDLKIRNTSSGTNYTSAKFSKINQTWFHVKYPSLLSDYILELLGVKNN